jgi:penicillin-binding protein 1C
MPENGFKKKWYKIIDPEMQGWMEENQISFQKIPTHNPDCEAIFKEGVPKITFPISGTEYLINKKSPEPLVLTCKTATDVSKVYWYVNNKFYKAAQANEKQFFLPDEGSIKISCTDDKGRNRDIWIKVKYISL